MYSTVSAHILSIGMCTLYHSLPMQWRAVEYGVWSIGLDWRWNWGYYVIERRRTMVLYKSVTRVCQGLERSPYVHVVHIEADIERTLCSYFVIA